jgi:hypothetical protein
MSRISSCCYAMAIIALISSISPGWAESAVPGAKFIVFDALLYQGKPDMGKYGMLPIIQMNRPDGTAAGLDEAKTRERMSALKGLNGAVFLDYESWPLSGVSEDIIAGNVDKFIRVTKIVREAAPKATIGYYGVMPCGEYWGLVKHDQTKIKDWKECNREGEAIAVHVDAIFPSAYTFYNDQRDWDVYATAMIEEARRYKKPVYVFLWPEFHVSNRLLRGTNIPAQFWRHQLELCRGLADGIVIWGGWEEQWQEGAAWWSETKAFMAAMNPT